MECLLLWHTNKGGIVVTLHVSVDDINREGIQNFDPEVNFDACDCMIIVHLFTLKA
jgi:hypothetical protein